MIGREFILRTDHGSLVWLHKFKEPDGQIARWLQQLASYTFQIQHRPGKRHGNADGLTRMNIQNGKCKQCKLNVTEATDEEQYYHIEDLCKLTNGEDVQSCNYMCAIKTLFQDQDEIPIACYSSDTVRQSVFQIVRYEPNLRNSRINH